MPQLKHDKDEGQQMPRRPYQTPQLKAYGTVKGLTAGGSTNKKETHPNKPGSMS